MPSKPSNKPRDINEPWEVTQDRPSPFEPVKYEETNFVPYKNAEEYVQIIQEAADRGEPIEAIHRYDEQHTMPGYYSAAEILNGTVWVTFVPEKLGGKYWVTINEPKQRRKQ